MCLDNRLFSILLSSLLFAFSTVAQSETGFLDKRFSLNMQSYEYQVYLPADYSNEKEWPVVLFLHGAGERGDNALLPTEVGIGSAIRKNPALFPAIVVFPQCSFNEWWSSEVCEQIAMTTLEHTISEYKVDSDRLYLSGVSMGGYGVWHFASKYPTKWAALHSIAGRVRPARGYTPQKGTIPEQYSGEDLYRHTAIAVQHLPIWIVHGGKDNIVPVRESRKMNQYLSSLGAEVTYKEYEQHWHNVWDEAYADEESLAWLFQQVKLVEGL